MPSPIPRLPKHTLLSTPYRLEPRDYNATLANVLHNYSDVDVLRHFLGAPIRNAIPLLNEAAIVCLDIEWWQKEPHPTTEIGVAELMVKHVAPNMHAENILTGIQVAHARIASNAHLRNHFVGAGDPENFHFGTSKFVSVDEAKIVLQNTFLRDRQSFTRGKPIQPIILIGHAVENEFEHIKRALGVDLRSYGSIIKVIDTQQMAQKANIKGPKGPVIGLGGLLAHFNIEIPDLHTAGNDAAGTLIAAVLLALKEDLYVRFPGPNFTAPDGTTLQHVVNYMSELGNAAPGPSWGKEVYCTRCNRENHYRAACFTKLNCDICRSSGVIRLYNAARTHDTSKCLYQYQALPPLDHNPNPITSYPNFD